MFVLLFTLGFMSYRLVNSQPVYDDVVQNLYGYGYQYFALPNDFSADTVYFFVKSDSIGIDPNLVQDYNFIALNNNTWATWLLAYDTGVEYEFSHYVHDTYFVSPYDSSSWGLDSHIEYDTAILTIPKFVVIMYSLYEFWTQPEWDSL